MKKELKKQRFGLLLTVAVFFSVAIALLFINKDDGDKPIEAITADKKEISVHINDEKAEKKAELLSDNSIDYKSNIRLISTTLSNNTDRIKATIMYIDEHLSYPIKLKSQLPFYEDLFLDEVYSKSAVIFNEKTEETFEIILDRDEELQASNEANRTKIYKKMMEGVQGKTPQEKSALTVGVMQLIESKLGRRDKETLMSGQGSFAPYREQGSKEMAGLWVTTLVPRSFYDQLGLEQWDVILEINGIPMTSPEATTQALDPLSKSEELTLIVKRLESQDPQEYSEPFTLSTQALTMSGYPEEPYQLKYDVN